VVTTPAGQLDRLPTRHAARIVLEIIEKPQTSLTCATGSCLATQKRIRRHFDPAARTEFDMLVFKAWRRDPEASVDLAELIACPGHARPSSRLRPRLSAGSSGIPSSMARKWWRTRAA
jgi:hypothetical protein